jgi:hypothetical protein
VRHVALELAKRRDVFDDEHPPFLLLTRNDSRLRAQLDPSIPELVFALYDGP